MPDDHSGFSPEQVVARIRERSRLLCASLPKDPAATDADAWTAADHLLHIDAWHRRLVTWLAAAEAGEAVVRPEPRYTFDQTDELNARDYEAGKGTPLPEAECRFDESLAEVETSIQRLSHEQLNALGYYPWLPEDAPLLYFVAGNTYGHYQEHSGASNRSDEPAGSSGGRSREAANE